MAGRAQARRRGPGGQARRATRSRTRRAANLAVHKGGVIAAADLINERIVARRRRRRRRGAVAHEDVGKRAAGFARQRPRADRVCNLPAARGVLLVEKLRRDNRPRQRHVRGQGEAAAGIRAAVYVLVRRSLRVVGCKGRGGGWVCTQAEEPIDWQRGVSACARTGNATGATPVLAQAGCTVTSMATLLPMLK